MKDVNSQEADLSILEYNLSLTYEQRLLNHEKALRLLGEIMRARKDLYGEFESHPPASPEKQN